MKFHPLKLPRYMPTAIVASAILYLTLAPDPVPGTDLMLFQGTDKAVHAIMMLGLMLTASFDYARTSYQAVSRVPLINYAIIAGMTILFGAAIEVVQEISGLGRSAEIADLIADAIGALIGLLLAPSVTTSVIRFLRQY